MNISTHHIHTIDIVYISMFPATVMHTILVHRYFRSVEHGGFVHIIPRVQIKRGSLVVRE